MFRQFLSCEKTNPSKLVSIMLVFSRLRLNKGVSSNFNGSYSIKHWININSLSISIKILGKHYAVMFYLIIRNIHCSKHRVEKFSNVTSGRSGHEVHGIKKVKKSPRAPYFKLWGRHTEDLAAESMQSKPISLL